MIALNRAKLFAVGVTAVVFILSSLAAKTFGGDKWVAELVSEDSDCVILHQLSTDNPSTVTLTIPETLRAEDFATPLVIKGVTDKMVKPAQEKTASSESICIRCFPPAKGSFCRKILNDTM